MAVEGINETWQSGLGNIPNDLWEGPEEDRKIAFERVKNRREKDQRRRRYSKIELREGDSVLVFDSVMASSREDKFSPIWKGPMKLGRKVSEHLWAVIDDTPVGPGRKAKGIYHIEHIQKFEL